MEYLYRIGSRHPDPIIASKEWRRNSSREFLCNECWRVKRDIFPKPLDISLCSYKRNDIGGGVSHGGACVYHRDFIAQIFDHMKGFAFGKCYSETGDLIPELVTVYSKEYIISRGNQNSGYRVCDTCGNVNTYAISGKIYVLRKQLCEGKKVYSSANSFLFISDDLLDKLDFSQWKYAKLDKVLIRDKSIDGQHFPGDPA
jgi:hypothetical protein